MKGAGIIIKKELSRVFSDKKMIFSLFILPAILVIGIYSLMGKMLTGMIDDVEAHTSLVYAVNCPDEAKTIIEESGFAAGASITYLQENEYNAQVEDLRNQVLEGKTDLIVYFDTEFMSKIDAYKGKGDPIPQIRVSYNSTENYSSAANSTFTEKVVTGLQTALLAERLGNLEQLTVFNTEPDLIEKEEKAKGEYLSMLLPYLITMLLFAGAMSLGMDAMAGEKERGTLASMLLSPVNRRDIVVGKLVSLSILSGISAIVYSVSMVIAMPMMGTVMTGGQEVEGMSLSPLQIVELLLIMLVMVYLYVGIISLLSILAKNSKEAGTYVSPIYIVVILAGMLTMFTNGSEVPIYRYAIPIYGNALAIKDLVVNELQTANFLVSIGGTLLLAIIITFGITKAFNSEKVMFNA